MIQNFTWGVASFCKDLFPAGLVVDPRTDSLVLNSRTGHVQFYNTHTQKLLYNVSKILNIDIEENRKKRNEKQITPVKFYRLTLLPKMF